MLGELGDAIAGKVLIDVDEPHEARYALAPRQVEPKVDGIALDGYVAADDADAKAKTLAILKS